jgi:hypothetical protein
LPEAHKYRFAGDFSALIGFENLSVRRGQVVTRDGLSPVLLEQLFQRGAKLEALPA